MAKFLLPHELTAEHFDADSDAPETSDLYDWAEEFFGLREDDIDELNEAISIALSEAVGEPVCIGHGRDNRDELQAKLIPEQLLAIWQEALGITQTA